MSCFWGRIFLHCELLAFKPRQTRTQSYSVVCMYFVTSFFGGGSFYTVKCLHLNRDGLKHNVLLPCIFVTWMALFLNIHCKSVFSALPVLFQWAVQKNHPLNHRFFKKRHLHNQWMRSNLITSFLHCELLAFKPRQSQTRSYSVVYIYILSWCLFGRQIFTCAYSFLHCELLAFKPRHSQTQS
jgi:hypothetical protein